MLVAVVDDDRARADMLMRMVRDSPVWAEYHGGGVCAAGECDVRCFGSVGEFERFSHVEACSFDVVIVDGRVIGDAGAADDAAARRLFSRDGVTQVICITEDADGRSIGSVTQPVGFLMKPVTREAMDGMLSKALRRRAERAERPVIIVSEGHTRVVQPRDVMWVESHRRLLCIHTCYGDMTTYLKLAQAAMMFPDRFVRCHQSFLVNLDYVTTWNSDRFVLTDGRVIPISQRRRAETRAAVLAYARTMR